MANPDRGRRRAWDGWERERQKKARTRDSDSPKNKVVALGDAVTGWVQSENHESHVREATLFTHWSEYVGSAVAAQASPLRLERGRLVLSVPDSSWRHQLLFMKKELIASINRHIGTSLVKEIVLTS